MADADIIAALVALFKSDSVIAGITDGDVFGVELPTEAANRMPSQMLVVSPSGGTGIAAESYADLDSQRVDVKAYAATPREANELRLIAMTLLRKLRRQAVALVDGSKVLVHSASAAGGFFSARDADGLWPQSFQSFTILYSLQEIAP